jgi:nuclear transport factor 2 (NTF2) superfamily protein
MTTQIKVPFTLESTILKMQRAEDKWNNQQLEEITLADINDSDWMDREDFGQRFRAYGNENCQFGHEYLMHI